MLDAYSKCCESMIAHCDNCRVVARGMRLRSANASAHLSPVALSSVAPPRWLLLLAGRTANAFCGISIQIGNKLPQHYGASDQALCFIMPDQSSWQLLPDLYRNRAVSRSIPRPLSRPAPRSIPRPAPRTMSHPASHAGRA